MTSNADMPIPMPDVPGADAGRGGLPSRSDLTLLQRTIVDTSAIADLGLWRSYPACVYHHVRSVARLQRLRFRLYGGNGERLLRLLQRHIERAPEWM